MIADERARWGCCSAATARGPRVEPGTRRVAIAAVQVNGVPDRGRRGALDRRRDRRLKRPRREALTISFGGGAVIYTRIGLCRICSNESADALRVGGDERLARAELRRQIGRLERELARLVVEAFPRVEIDAARRRPRGEPRIARTSGSWSGCATRSRIGSPRPAWPSASGPSWRLSNRELLRRMLAAPAKHKWVRVSRADIGEPGCGHWHSRPRLGPLGMLMGWWRVKVSSGCPLSGRLAAVER